MPTMCDIPTMLNFFGLTHQKGPCDSCAGRVKQKVNILVKTETAVVNSTKDFYNACKQNLEKDIPGGCVHFLQTFHFSGKLSSRPKTDKFTAVPDTHKIHSIAPWVQPHIIKYQVNFLCCCHDCLHGHGECENKICPAEWLAFDLRRRWFVTPLMNSWNVIHICK